MAKRILVVDDEASIIKGLKYSLVQDGYEVDEAYDGKEALDMFARAEYDLVLLDVMLPEVDGMEVLRRIRETSGTPVIMLTAKGEDMDKILGLEYGADDYMTKPFNILEVKARIRSIFRRASLASAASAPQREEQRIIKDGDIEINLDNRSTLVRGMEIELTSKEFDIMHLFMSSPGKVFTREQIGSIVWNNEALGDMRTVDVHIRRLREKVEKTPSQPDYIHTKWGVGYYFAQR